MDYLKFIVSNQKKESISIQRVTHKLKSQPIMNAADGSDLPRSFIGQENVPCPQNIVGQCR